MEGAELQIPFGGASHRFPYEKFEEKKVAVKFFARAHRVGCPTKVSGILECPVVAQQKTLLATLSLHTANVFQSPVLSDQCPEHPPTDQTTTDGERDDLSLCATETNSGLHSSYILSSIW